MSVLASSNQDRWLDLNDLLRDLVTQGFIDQSSAEDALTCGARPRTSSCIRWSSSLPSSLMTSSVQVANWIWKP